MGVDQGTLQGNRPLDRGDPWESTGRPMENVTLHLS